MLTHIPITRTTTVFSSGDPIPFDVLQLYIPSSILVMALICKLPLGYKSVSEDAEIGMKSIPSPAISNIYTNYD